MSFEINPCKATLNHLDKTGYKDYNNVNNLCYETCYNWFGSGSNREGTECYKNCDQCVIPFIHARGKDTCYFDPRPPAVFTNPSYFPKLYMESGDKNGSLKKCKDLCSNEANHKLECQQRCEIDANSVVEDIKEGYRYKDYAKANPGIFYTMFILVGILLAIMVAIFLWVLFANKE